MEIGVGLPTTVPDKDGTTLPQWARLAEQYGFASLGVLDRLVYDNYESLVSLAAAAAVTERIRLASTILIAGYRNGGALLAKQAATVDAISGGRLVLGVAAGGREDDYAATGAEYLGRGKLLDQLLTELRETWDGAGPVPGIGPRPVRDGRIPLLVGGHSAAAMRRSARFGTGWIAGGSSVTAYAELVRRAKQAWTDEGRTDRPRMVSLVYACLGPDAGRVAGGYLRGYYSFVSAKAERTATGVLTDAQQIRDAAQAYAEAGCDELILLPCSAELEQLRLLADAAL
ncbi:LLM class flavin-dependent oxidoreductase [Streptacidiphilus sp. PB12-B1b]|uniref:LLM class flavin-dependent oxidoreductase n=1 Tax=Streptacidiphilus sp. PB12-B1b TaxID=2705012 RepID=UPI0015F818E0|nr:LLM class flavin-dependent oxidoreductase [Streptacidiphilus sp. PB12-B1b]QMU78175.1 LLM class flavin-dependent oxidoreductase [Streptacidiphilus sp. PB12-B1b]